MSSTFYRRRDFSLMPPIMYPPRALLYILLPLILAIIVAIYLRTTIDSRSLQCAALSNALKGKVSYPGNITYAQSSNSYWSKQEQSLAPTCIVTPTNTNDVVIAIKELTSTNFAIRGGGHTPWAGSANINGGVTIDMTSIKDITVNNNKTIASVGAGAVWGDVYRKMDSSGLAVIGGRGSSIGVGGLLTGGGISYFSARKGFACDNVVNYEIVLANGKVVNANAKENYDLWLALKGGSNNFGVITRFDLRSFPQGDFWGGIIVYDDSTSPSLLKAFSKLNKAVGFDEYAALILSFTYVASTGFFTSANIQYTKPVPNPPAFQPFTLAQPQYTNSMRISNQTDFTTEFVEFQPNGRRQLYVTNTFKNDISFLNYVYALYKTAVGRLPDAPGLALTLTIQPIPPAITSKAAPLGGNSLGLNPSEGALVLCLISGTWDSPENDAVIESTAKGLNSQIIAAAKSNGLFNKWIYLNYAAKFQDPIAGYGPANHAKLRAVSRRYDPQALFQRHVPGGFKLFQYDKYTD